MEPVATRRGLLAGGSLLVGFALFGRTAGAAGPGIATDGSVVGSSAKNVAPDAVDSYIAIAEDGRVTVFSGKVDLGTGVRTALTQIAAEELDVPLDRISVLEGDTLLTPDQGPTYGSLSIQNGGMQVRQAAATARKHLIGLAAARLGVPEDSLRVVDGVIQPQAGGAGLSYAELVAGGQVQMKLDKDATPKDPAAYRHVGQSVPRLDIPAKCTGGFTYMQDFRLDGMLHGRVVRPPAIGADLQSVDETSVQSVPGVIKVVRDGNFLGVVARTEWGAIKAAEALHATWSQPQTLPDQAKLWEHVRATKTVKDDVTSTVGDTAAAMAAPGARRISATYAYPIHTHGSIGPSCAVADVRDGKVTVWTASQMTHQLRKQVAAMLRVADADVRCIYLDGSGCYGRNGHEDAAADAVLLARAAGQPVRVQWSREDEHGWDPKGPPTLIDLRAMLDDAGNVQAWESEFFIPQGAAGNVPLVAADLAGLPHETAMSPGNIIGNSALPYAFPNIRTVCHRLETTPFRPSWIRTPGRMQNTYANEAFLDELAAAAGADPIEYRLRSLKDARGVELIHRLAKLAAWQPRPSPARDAATGGIARGRGVSYVKYELNRTYVGAVAEVEVNRGTGAVRVTRVFIAHDCGQIINPDGLRNQIEGNVIQTTSRTLMEEVAFDRAAVTSLDWGSYPIITFPDVPRVEIDLIERQEEKPWGGGEPSSAVIPSAISNAVFDAAGVRLRTAPYTPDRVKAAMRSI